MHQTVLPHHRGLALGQPEDGKPRGRDLWVTRFLLGGGLERGWFTPAALRHVNVNSKRFAIRPVFPTYCGHCAGGYLVPAVV